MDADKEAREIVGRWHIGVYRGAHAGLVSDVAAALRQARAEAVEECARVADGFTCGGCGMDGESGAAIRALASPAPEADHGPEPTIEPRERRPAIFRLKVTETPPPLPIEEAERG